MHKITISIIHLYILGCNKRYSQKHEYVKSDDKEGQV